MKYIGQVSYNINCNFTNYGSALQSWALSQMIDKLGAEYGIQSKLIDYCPRVLEDSDCLNPTKKMWDTDDEARKQIELMMPAIRLQRQPTRLVGQLQIDKLVMCHNQNSCSWVQYCWAKVQTNYN